MAQYNKLSWYNVMFWSLYSVEIREISGNEKFCIQHVKYTHNIHVWIFQSKKLERTEQSRKSVSLWVGQTYKSMQSKYHLYITWPLHEQALPLSSKFTKRPWLSTCKEFGYFNVSYVYIIHTHNPKFGKPTHIATNACGYYAHQYGLYICTCMFFITISHNTTFHKFAH